MSVPTIAVTIPPAWPEAIPDLGLRHIGPYAPCARCGRGTWARYGETALCSPCAQTELFWARTGEVLTPAGPSGPPLSKLGLS